MCVIMHKPADVSLSEQDAINAHRINDDGFGYMYYDPGRKKIIADKGVFKEPDEILRVVKELQSKEVCYHFRIKTHGIISNQSCHPFRVTSKKKHGMEIYFMHNGTISGMDAKKDESDTQAFNNNILFPMLRKNPRMIEEPAFRILVESMIGKWNKLCFMYGEGKILKFNEDQGAKHEGMWVSNKNFVGYGGQSYSRGPYSIENGYYNYDRALDSEQWDKDRNDFFTKHGKKVPTALLQGESVTVGDKVCIWHDTDTAYYAEGEIMSLNSPYTAMIKFKNKDDQLMSTSFILQSGKSSVHLAGYECMALHMPTFDASKKVEEMESSLTSRELNDNIDDLTKVRETLKIEGPKQTCDLPPKEEATSAKKLVSFGNIIVDANNRWGGYSVEDSFMEYTKDKITFCDIYNMDAQERFTWFNNNVETGFNMFQDLVEKIMFDDLDSGVASNDEVEDDEPSEEEEILLMAAQAAGITH